MKEHLADEQLSPLLAQWYKSAEQSCSYTIAEGLLCLTLVEGGMAGCFLRQDTAHKYIHALLDFPAAKQLECWFISPITVHEYHRDILAFLEASLVSTSSYCFGGGYIEIEKQNDIRVFGCSTQFGRAEHIRARTHFLKLLTNTRFNFGD
jgi:hypothetical protein